MDFKQFKTGPNDNDRRLDKVIRIFASDLSLAEIYKGIRKGLIKVNNKKTKAEYRIQENDVIFIADFLFEKADKNENQLKEKQEHRQTSPEKKLLENMPEIIFENKDILIINKPYNVNVHGDKNSLDKIVQEYYNSKSITDSLSFKPGPVHRLDKKTTGLLAFSMSIEGGRWFADNIKNHTIQKKYYGLVEGNISKKENWKDLILNNQEDSSKGFHKVLAKSLNQNTKNTKNTKENTKDEKIAETTVTPLAQGTNNGNKVTLVEFHIKTGRKHQIRAQSALHNHPLAGDTAYGGKKLNIGNQDFYLTARELIIPKNNPLNLPENLKVMLPKDFINVLKRCGIEKTGV